MSYGWIEYLKHLEERSNPEPLLMDTPTGKPLPQPPPMNDWRPDYGRAPLSVLPFDVLTRLAGVFSLGRSKYGANNWMDKDNGGGDHLDAALRHIGKHCDGEELDESGFAHLDHAASRLMMHIGKRIRCVDGE